MSLPAEHTESGPVTGLLARWQDGDPAALDRLMPLVYNELRRLARGRLQNCFEPATIQATGLVHELYLRFREARIRVESRAHFYAIAAHAMRCMLVDRMRRRRAAKREGHHMHLDTVSLRDVSQNGDVDLIRLDDALTALAAIDPLKSQVVELRFFGGLTAEETSEALGLSPRSVARQWAMAKAWLHGELKRGA